MNPYRRKEEPKGFVHHLKTYGESYIAGALVVAMGALYVGLKHREEMRNKPPSRLEQQVDQETTAPLQTNIITNER